MAPVSKVEAVEVIYEQIEFVVEEKCYKMKTFHLSEWFAKIMYSIQKIPQTWFCLSVLYSPKLLSKLDITIYDYLKKIWYFG